MAGSEQVTLGIRPEDVELVDSVETDHDFRTRIDVIEPMGDENNVYLAFEGGDRTFVATVRGSRRLTEGAAVVARLPESAVHIFDGRTGEALKRRSLESLQLTEPDL